MTNAIGFNKDFQIYATGESSSLCVNSMKGVAFRPPVSTPSPFQSLASRQIKVISRLSGTTETPDSGGVSEKEKMLCECIKRYKGSLVGLLDTIPEVCRTLPVLTCFFYKLKNTPQESLSDEEREALRQSLTTSLSKYPSIPKGALAQIVHIFGHQFRTASPTLLNQFVNAAIEHVADFSSTEYYLLLSGLSHFGNAQLKMPLERLGQRIPPGIWSEICREFDSKKVAPVLERLNHATALGSCWKSLLKSMPQSDLLLSELYRSRFSQWTSEEWRTLEKRLDGFLIDADRDGILRVCLACTYSVFHSQALYDRVSSLCVAEQLDREEFSPEQILILFKYLALYGYTDAQANMAHDFLVDRLLDCRAYKNDFLLDALLLAARIGLTVELKSVAEIYDHLIRQLDDHPFPEQEMDKLAIAIRIFGDSHDLKRLTIKMGKHDTYSDGLAQRGFKLISPLLKKNSLTRSLKVIWNGNINGCNVDLIITGFKTAGIPHQRMMAIWLDGRNHFFCNNSDRKFFKSLRDREVSHLAEVATFDLHPDAEMGFEKLQRFIENKITRWNKQSEPTALFPSHRGYDPIFTE